MNIALSPVLRLSGDIHHTGHNLYGSAKIARTFGLVEWNKDRGITIQVRKITDDEALRYDESYRFSNVRSLENGIVQHIRYGIVGLQDFRSSPAILYNRFYRTWAQLRLSSAPSVAEHVADLATLKLLASDILPLHGAVVSRGGKSVLITGLPNVGKTTSTIRLLRQGFSYQSEDIALIDSDGKSFGVPYTISLEVSGIEAMARSFSSLIFKKTSMARRSLLEVDRNVEAYVDEAELRHVVVLDTSRDSVEKDISGEEVLEFLLAINRREFRYAGNPLLIGATCCDPSIALDWYTVRERELLTALLNRTALHRVGALNVSKRVDRTCTLISDLLA